MQGAYVADHVSVVKDSQIKFKKQRLSICDVTHPYTGERV